MKRVGEVAAVTDRFAVDPDNNVSGAKPSLSQRGFPFYPNGTNTPCPSFAPKKSPS